MKVLLAQTCPTLCDPMDGSPPGSSVYGALQARILEWVAIPFSRGSSPPRGRTQVRCSAGRFSTVWANRGSKSHITFLKSSFSKIPLGWCLSLMSFPGGAFPGHTAFGKVCPGASLLFNWSRVDSQCCVSLRCPGAPLNRHFQNKDLLCGHLRSVLLFV